MKVLVVGGGGREHSIVWKLSKSERIDKLYCAPGNGGIAELAECVGIKADDVGGIADFAKRNSVGLVVIGPDDPMALGCADLCESYGIRVFGPGKAGAKLEWSKVYSKGLMKKYNIPAADFEVFRNADDAYGALGRSRYPLVVKADGLALGKGVIIAQDRREAENAIRSLMIDKTFGEAGAEILFEECLEGPEMTILAFTDGKTIKPMLCSQDYKRAFDGDLGPNTGGMGAYAPAPIYTAEVESECWEKIYNPTLDMLKKENIKYHGILYFGLMLTRGGVRLIEYNSRFGDPEAQALLPLLKNDLLDVIEAVIEDRLDNVELKWENGFSACVVAASGGYPEKYRTGYEVKIVENLRALYFHAGTRLENGVLVTSGGRVLCAVSVADTLGEAVDRAYGAIRGVSFTDRYYRKDIAALYKNNY